jgi:uncharacterized protein (DUF1501 family)
MLHLADQAAVRFCDGIHRRNFLRLGALSTLGLSLGDLWTARAAAAKPKPGNTGKARSCIFVFLAGAPAHQETFDPKPDAPAEFRGEFKPIQTNVPGTLVCELLPKLAQLADKYCVVRSCTHDDPEHNSAAYAHLTGRMHPLKGRIAPPTPDDFPPFGAVVGKLKPTKKPVPNWVTLPEYMINAGVPFPSQNAGFLGSPCDPLFVKGDPAQPGFKLDSLRTSPELETRLEDRWALNLQLDNFARGADRSDAVRSMTGHYQRAYSLLSSPLTRDAFDLSKEKEELRTQYGKNTWGQCLLLARRLVEARVPLVTVYLTNAGGGMAWDTHGGHFKQCKDNLLPQFDLALSALLRDLDQRGLLGETLVVSGGEFGRTPKINDNAGRDHWPWVYSTLYAGGGIKGGIVHGASDRSGGQPSLLPVKPANLAATLYHCLGIDPASEIHDRLNRPFAIAQGEPVNAILG